MSVGLWTISATHDMPSLELLYATSRPTSVRVVDRYGRTLATRGANDIGAAELSDLPPHLIDAVLATEDTRFIHHIGVDIEAIGRAALSNLRDKSSAQGGSTLTQQLVKNVFLTPEKRMRRKAQEALLSLHLERTLSKFEILELYFNRVYFGGGAWGVEAAARTYFDTDAADLDLAQSAMLAGLLKAPSGYNPIARPDRAARRTALVLDVMAAQRRIDNGQQWRALSQPLNITPPIRASNANYFTDWVWGEMEDLIGTPDPQMGDIVIRTTLDLDAQERAEAAVAAHLDATIAATGQGLQAALVSLDGDGAVRAMVGGRSYLESEFNRATQARRQPGSAFKPVVYLAALEAGLSPWTVRDDAPIEIDGWSPENFSEDFAGPVTLETALAQSINTVAVAVAEEIDRDRVVGTGRRLGLDGLSPLRSLALGAQDVSPLALTAAYWPFANWGQPTQPHGIVSITKPDGTPLYDRKSQRRTRVIAPGDLADLNRMMVAAVERGTGRRARVPGHRVGGKTGTTNEARDAWFVGYVPGRVTGVWVGADDYSPMHTITGGTTPARIFSEFMRADLGEGGTQFAQLPVSTRPRIVPDAQAPTLDTLLRDIEATLP